MLDGIAGSLASRSFSNAATLVHRAFRQVDLGAAAPDHDEPIESVLLLEALHVVAELVGHLAFVRALLDVRAVQTLDVADRTPRTSDESVRAPAALFRAVPVRARRPSWRRRPSCLENVPTAEDHVVEGRQRHEVPDERRAASVRLPRRLRTHLCQRADRLGETAANGEHAGDRRRADGAHTDEENAQFPRRFCDFWRIFHDLELYHQGRGVRQFVVQVVQDVDDRTVARQHGGGEVGNRVLIVGCSDPP